MKLAFEEAKKGINTWTNPQVGAVIVKNDQVLGQGHHATFGHEHAEINAFKSLKNINDAKNATLYVTLEPCSHFGKTPPCVQKIAELGVKKVVIGQIDPNPLVSGKGVKYLQEHGVEVEEQLISSELNRLYNYFYKNNRPLVTVKYAMTLDGKINKNDGQRSIVSNQATFEDSQQLRSQQQVILIGENTLKIDDPALTVRDRKMLFPPIRAVVVRDINQISLDLKIFQTDEPIWFFSETKNHRTLPKNVEVIVGEWTPENILNYLTAQKIQAVLVEGGSFLQAKFLSAGLVEKLVIYLANKIYGSGLPAVWGVDFDPLDFAKPTVESLADNLKITTWRKD